MTTPISLFIAVDVTPKTIAFSHQILRIAENILDSLKINDDVGCVLVSDKVISTVPFKTLRTHVQKQDILHEISMSNDAVASDGGNPARVMQYVIDAIENRPAGNSWRPVYVVLITDGRPLRSQRQQIVEGLQDRGAAFAAVAETIRKNAGAATLLDVFVTNNHHHHKPFGALVSSPEFIPGVPVKLFRLDGERSLIQLTWHIRDRLRQCRLSVQLSDLPQSVAKRKAPGHIRIPTVFCKR